MQTAGEADGPIDYLAVYLPEMGSGHHATIPITSSDQGDVLKRAFDARPSGKRLSRIVRANNPSQSLWESGKGWLPTLEEQQRQG